MTQGFDNPVDYSRLAPNRHQRHEGVDFAPVGEARNLQSIPVIAVANGVITSVRRQAGGYGNYITMRFDDGRYGALYAHLDSVNVRAGQHLREGETIGSMGNTGNSTGRHLHFNLLDLSASRGNYVYPQVVDPVPFLAGESTTVVRLVNEQPIAPGNPRSTKPPVRYQVDSPEPGSDYPPGMPGADTPPVPIHYPPRLPYPTHPVTAQTESQFFPTSFTRRATIPEQILVNLGADVTGNEPVYDVGESVDNAVQSAAQSAAESVLDSIQERLPEGQEVEDYIQEKAPYVVLAIVGIVVLLLGLARLVFSSNPMK
jgi:hypothetical protein